nr:hypothetical protein [Acidobacteriota bacterium]
TLAVVDALKVKLFGEEKAAVLKHHAASADAYELFLKGRFHSYKYTAQGWKRAIEFFERAIDIQPDYALAYAGIAMSRGCQWFFGLLPAEQTIPQCKTASDKALAIDQDLAEAHLPRAIITFFYDWDWQKAEQEFQRPIVLNPNDAEALSYYAMFLGFDGRGGANDRDAAGAASRDPIPRRHRHSPRPDALRGIHNSSPVGRLRADRHLVEGVRRT